MTFRTILSVIGIEQGDDDLKLAADLCDGIGAHLSVLVLALYAPPPIGEYVVSHAWLQERQADLDRLKKRTAAVTASLAVRETSADITGDYPEIAWADDMIGRRARYADLTLIGPGLLAGGQIKGKAIEGALFSSGKPLLIVPEGSRPTLAPNGIPASRRHAPFANRLVS